MTFNFHCRNDLQHFEGYFVLSFWSYSIFVITKWWMKVDLVDEGSFCTSSVMVDEG